MIAFILTVTFMLPISPAQHVSISAPMSEAECRAAEKNAPLTIKAHGAVFVAASCSPVRVPK